MAELRSQAQGLEQIFQSYNGLKKRVRILEKDKQVLEDTLKARATTISNQKNLINESAEALQETMSALKIPEGEEAKEELEEKLPIFINQFKSLANEGKIVFNIEELKQKIVDETLAEANKKFAAEKEDMQVFLQQKITRNLELEVEIDELKVKNR